VVNVPQYIDRSTKTFIGGDAESGESVYLSHCAPCHGVDGAAIDFHEGEFVNDIASGNPWEFLHKVRMGQPGTAMTALYDVAGITMQDVTNLGAYAQSLMPSPSGNVTRGGRLYDKWWSEAGVPAPAGEHPLYPPAGAQSGSSTWRCKECHGWDYQGADGAYGSGSHFTGISGVWQSSNLSGEELYAILTGDLADHDFSPYIAEQDIWDLVDFLREGTAFIPTYVDLGTKTFKDGDAGAGSSAFSSICAVCHGYAGTAIDFGDSTFINDIATDNPWEFLHKARMGQPGTAMPALYDIQGRTIQDAVNVGAFAQTLEPTQIEGNVTRGGRLYDKWWSEAGVAEPTTDHPLYPDEGEKTGSTTWRCKECHGWDYQGAAGAYGSGSHFTGIGGIFAASGYDSGTLLGILSGDLVDHDFSSLLSEDDIADLVTFIQDGVDNIPDYVDLGSKTFKNANATNGELIFNPNCAPCHGTNGQQIDFGDGTFIRDIATDNPWEFLHKARMGQPSTAMTALYDNPLFTTQDAADVGAYGQTLE
jgi:mono/diheme cytochrome c family protein